MRTTAPLLAAFALALAPPSFGQETRLRHVNYLAFLGAAGEEVQIGVKSIPRDPYKDNLGVLVLDPRSRAVLEETVPLGAERVLKYKVETPGLHVTGTMTGETLCTARLVDKPFALIAWREAPLWICGSCARQYFTVPKGRKQVDLFVWASVTSEGATVKVLGPDDQVLLEKTDDFDQETKLTIPVPEGLDGQPWSFTLENPGQAKLFLDDVQVYLGQSLPPYLCEDPAWLEALTGRPRFAEEKIAVRIPLKAVGLSDGATVRLTFQLDSVPAAKMAALRVTAQDADYAREGSFTLNGKEPYLIPVTGDGAVETFTIMLRIEDLVAGENVLEFKHDNRASAGMWLTEMELLIGDDIRQFAGW